MTYAAVQSFRGVWWMDDREGYAGPRYDGELWSFIDGRRYSRLHGRMQRLFRGGYDAVEVRLHSGQMLRIKPRQAAA